MRGKYRSILHQFDVWHRAKKIKKENDKSCNEKGECFVAAVGEVNRTALLVVMRNL